MAHIEKRGKTYRITVYLNRTENGKKLQKRITYKPTSTTPAKIKKEVEAYAAEYEKKVLSGQDYDEKLTFLKFYEDWLKTYGTKELTPGELEGNEKTVRRVFIPEIGHLRINSIRGLHLQQIINDLEKKGLKPKTIQKYFSCISTVFNKAYKLELIENNPCKRVDLPKNTKDGEIHTFTVNQAQAFLNAIKNGITVHHPEKERKNGRIIPAYDEKRTFSYQFFVYFNLAIASGFRRGEMVGLKWKNIDFEKYLITIDHATSEAKSKGGKFDKDPKTAAGFRTISLPPEIFAALKEWQVLQDKKASELGTYWKGETDQKERYIFIQDNGAQMDLRTPSHKFKEILEAYNNSVSDEAEKLPEIKLHDLRHTMASVLIAAGIDIATVSRRMGHSDITTTLNTYTHALPDIDQSASVALSVALFNDSEKNDQKILENSDQKTQDKIITPVMNDSRKPSNNADMLS